ncbi:glycoside hydrolase domain-containing protein [Mycobacterium botniense]|uniref:glycoside hydrolase domain-containing protein n=1 Tax=Mycobacterium botniense TaxID=84962 RepID=UPI0024838576|nr:glycoside hydrolase domain-containing protein [Mycobacterium botniense]
MFVLWPRSSGPTSDLGKDGFDEGTAAQYTWMVPQNIAGLVGALGGRDAAAERLDRFATQLNAGPDEPYLWLGNEPGFAVPWLYNYLGQPWKTQETVARVRSELFGPTPVGEPGNDDLGALSSWYVWAALGMYPVTPGTPILTVNTPLLIASESPFPQADSSGSPPRGHPGSTAGPPIRRFFRSQSSAPVATSRSHSPPSPASSGVLPSPPRQRRSAGATRP